MKIISHSLFKSSGVVQDDDDVVEVPDQRHDEVQKNDDDVGGDIESQDGPTNKTVPTSWVYHERQIDLLLLCGMHALNNLAQRPAFTKEELDIIAKNLDKSEEAIGFDKEHRTRHFDERGNYTQDTLYEALLQKYGIKVIEAETRPPECEGFLGHKNNHWIVIRKTSERYWYLDSLEPRPILVDEIETKLKEMQNKSYSMMACVPSDDHKTLPRKLPNRLVPDLKQEFGELEFWHREADLVEDSANKKPQAGNIAAITSFFFSTESSGRPRNVRKLDEYDKERSTKPASKPLRAKEALIYLPGIGQYWSVDLLAKQLAGAFRVEAASLFRSTQDETSEQIFYGNKYASTKYTVSQVHKVLEGEEEMWPILDVFSLEYQENLTGEWNALSLLWQAVMLTVTVFIAIIASVPVFGRLVLAFLTRTGSSKNILEVFQGIAGALIISLLIAYLCLLLASVVLTFMKGEDGPEYKRPQQIVLLSTLAGIASPKRLQKAFVDLATQYVAVMQYMYFGANNQSLTGQLNFLINEVVQNGGYKRVHLVAYSFGSVIAIDAMFPAAPNEYKPAYDSVHNFVTMGCPFDMIRTYMPGYYMNRFVSASKLCQWTNIFVLGDVFGSNLRDDSSINDCYFDLSGWYGGMSMPIHNIPRKLSPGHGTNPWLQVISDLFLSGLFKHGNYWGDQVTDNDVSHCIVKDLFQGHWAFLKQGQKYIVAEPTFQSVKITGLKFT